MGQSCKLWYWSEIVKSVRLPVSEDCLVSGFWPLLRTNLSLMLDETLVSIVWPLGLMQSSYSPASRLILRVEVGLSFSSYFLRRSAIAYSCLLSIEYTCPILYGGCCLLLLRMSARLNQLICFLFFIQTIKLLLLCSDRFQKLQLFLILLHHRKRMLPSLIKQNSTKISNIPIDEAEDGNMIITAIDDKQSSPKPKIPSKKYQVYVIEDSAPPTVFPPNEIYTRLPSTVEFSRIVANVITSLSTSYFKQIQSKNEKRADTTIQKWTRYLNLEENKALVSDCFWLAICKFFRQDQFPNSQKQLEKRIADNYIGLFLSIDDKHENQLFFKQYFNVLSQSVFYSFFYAYPKSRSKFNNKLKDDLLSIYSKLFTGVQISNTKSYYEKWTLDLGTGNILARKPKVSEEQESKADPTKKAKISFNNSAFERTKKRETLPIRYSPIVQLYLRNHKYKTRNYVSEFKMKYSQADKNDKEKQEKFAEYRNQATRILEWSQAQKEEQEAKRLQLQSEIKAIKRETINHHKRLDRRKAEELERGAHEYANYLVSMLNAGITMTSLGVIRKNVS